MPEYDNTNRGTLFRNDERKHDRSPEYSGSINVGGVEYWLNGWVQEAKTTGRRFFSLTVRPKDKPAATRNEASQRMQAPRQDFDDSIPF